jgi:hypothetical protein
MGETSPKRSWRHRVLRRAPGILATLLLAVASLAGAAAGERGGDASVWFSDLPAHAPGAEAAAQRLVKPVWAALQGHAGADAALAASLVGAAEETGDRSGDSGDLPPRVVFVTAGDGVAEASVVRGEGRGLGAALRHALARYRALEPRREPAIVKLDIVAEVAPLGALREGLSCGVSPGLDGLALDRSTGVALVPDQLAAYAAVTRSGRIHGRLVAAALAGRPLAPGVRADPDALVSGRGWTFRTGAAAFVGGRVLALRRGHRRPRSLTAAQALEAARLGGRYLARSVAANGRFVYIHRPYGGAVPRDYNLTRHAGTLMALLEVYAATREPALLEAANRAAGYLLAHVKPGFADPRGTACAVEGDVIKLGATALSAIALTNWAQATGREDVRPVIIKLGRWLEQTQDERGEFTVHHRVHSMGRILPHRGAYAPGEAVLALTRIHELDAQTHWLDAAEKGARWVIQVRDGGLPDAELPHDHWLLYAMEQLGSRRPDPLWLKHTRRLVRAMIASQHRDPAEADWRGGWYEPPRSTPVATRAEGLTAAYRLLSGAGATDEELSAIREALDLATGFQLRTQYREESTLHLREPQRALGGFRGSLTDDEIRNDFVQHNVSALLRYARIAGGARGER